jgi:hypothetical protein
MALLDMGPKHVDLQECLLDKLLHSLLRQMADMSVLSPVISTLGLSVYVCR